MPNHVHMILSITEDSGRLTTAPTAKLFHDHIWFSRLFCDTLSGRSLIQYRGSVVYHNFNPSMAAPYNKIHPLQVNAVRILLSRDIPAGVERIILFGSSLDLTCNPHSDLDLAVIFDDPLDEEVVSSMYKTCKNLGRPFDILVLDKEDLIEPPLGSVEQEILKKGVVLYAKKESVFA